MATAPADYQPNPLFAGRALTLPSTCSEPPSEPAPRPVPPIIGEIIAMIGLHYRPSGQVDLEAHARTLVLLGEDLADVPPPLLDEAARRWARDSKFMPKASELRDLARKIQSESVTGTDAAGRQLQDHCDRLNALKGGPFWFVAGDAPHRRVESRPRTA